MATEDFYDAALSEKPEAYDLVEQAKDDLKWLMSLPRGRRIVWRWLENCGVFRCSPSDPHTMAVSEGRRLVGIGLQTDVLMLCRDDYVLMLTENQN